VPVAAEELLEGAVCVSELADVPEEGVPAEGVPEVQASRPNTITRARKRATVFFMF
jgi:hypothetical protein